MWPVAVFYGPGMSDFPVDVVRSKRRKRTVQASLRDGRIKVMVPDGLDPQEERRFVEELTERIITKRTSSDVDLEKRATALASRYDLPAPVEISWSDRQQQRWGSCTPREGRIRISRRLASMPEWVLDSVLVHELAHLEVEDHGPGFQALVQRYELTERAKGYLIAKSEGSHAPEPDVPRSP
jgi:predicted metal-dependent hydrolase